MDRTYNQSGSVHPCNADPKYTLRENGCLADIIPTLIQLMGMEQPADMTGESLLIEK